jgi:hypothetical protein
MPPVAPRRAAAAAVGCDTPRSRATELAFIHLYL